jgi:hypothetical protein
MTPSTLANPAIGDRPSAGGDDRLAITQLSDEDLILDVKRLAACERRATADLVAALAELDVRRLYLGQGCASLFAYCTQVLHLSEQAAYLRIQAARLVRRFPLALARLASGELTLTTLVLLGPQFTEANHLALIDEARHQGRRAVELIVARLRPQPDVPASIRKLPCRPGVGGEAAVGTTPGRSVGAAPAFAIAESQANRLPAPDLLSGELAPAAPAPPASCRDEAAPPSRCDVQTPRKPATVRPLAPSRYHLQVTISAETHAKLRHAQDLLRHVVPDGDPAVILDRALTLLVERLERDRAKKTIRPQTVRRAVRTGGGEASTSDGGKSAGEREAQRREPERVEVSSAGADSEHAVRCDTPPKGGEVGVARGCPPGASPTAVCRRRVPAAVVRAVWQRDEGRCTFVGVEGRCRETAFLELHHVVPVARGGPSTVENLAVRCRAHNQGEAVRDFGLEAVAAGRVRARQRREGEAVSTLFGQS